MDFRKVKGEGVVIDNKGSTIHCELWSAGDPKPPYLLLLHGAGGLLGKEAAEARELKPIEAALGKFAAICEQVAPPFTVIVAHRPACGLSPPLVSNDEPVTYSHMADWYRTCLEQLDVDGQLFMLSHSLGGAIAAHLTDVADYWLDADGSLPEFHFSAGSIRVIAPAVDRDLVSIGLYPNRFTVNQVRGSTRINLPGSVAEHSEIGPTDCKYYGFPRDSKELVRQQRDPSRTGGRHDFGRWPITPEEEELWSWWQELKVIKFDGWQILIPETNHQLITEKSGPRVFATVLQTLYEKESQLPAELRKLGIELKTASDLSQGEEYSSFSSMPLSPLVQPGGKAYHYYLISARPGGSGNVLAYLKEEIPEVKWNKDGDYFCIQGNEEEHQKPKGARRRPTLQLRALIRQRRGIK